MKKKEILRKVYNIKTQVDDLIDEIKKSDDITDDNTLHSSEHIKQSLKNGQNEVWAAVPGFEESYMVSNLGRVKRISQAKGTRVGIILKHVNTGTVIYKVQNNGLGIYKDYRKPSVCLYNGGNHKNIRIHRLIALAFVDTTKMNERKIIPGTMDEIRDEKTRLIIEKIDEMKPATLNNLRINFIKRGERHWNHKLNNDLVELVRSNLDMKFKDFFTTHGNVFPNVCLDTIRKVYSGDSWRVRTEPIEPMSNPQENYPNGELYKLVKTSIISDQLNL